MYSILQVPGYQQILRRGAVANGSRRVLLQWLGRSGLMWRWAHWPEMIAASWEGAAGPVGRTRKRFSGITSCSQLAVLSSTRAEAISPRGDGTTASTDLHSAYFTTMLFIS